MFVRTVDASAMSPKPSATCAPFLWVVGELGDLCLFGVFADSFCSHFRVYSNVLHVRSCFQRVHVVSEPLWPLYVRILRFYQVSLRFSSRFGILTIFFSYFQRCAHR